MKSLLVALHLLVALLISGSLLNAQVVGIGSGAGASIRSMEGNPFSADVIIQRSKMLADGNRIDQELHGKIYRDSQGRTRNEDEIFLPTGEKRQHIFIHDPAQRLTITLDPIGKTANVFHFPNPAERPPMPPPTEAASQLERPKVTHTSEPLGHLTIEGFDAIGTKMTHTIPANTMGNAQSLVSVTELWRSTELNVELVVKNSDPQNGENVRKLVNIQRGEPDPALFQVPPDYTVRDTPAAR